MIVKMKFVNITGPKNDIDRVIDHYLSNYEIHLENALYEYKSLKNLKPFIEPNPYKDLLHRASEIISLVDYSGIPEAADNLDEAANIINTLDSELKEIYLEKSVLEGKRTALLASLNKIKPFRELNYDLSTILNFKFLSYRFGRISKEYWDKFQSYVYDDLATVFVKCMIDEDYIWGVYFVPAKECDKVDAVYTSLHFETFLVPDEYSGTPDESFHTLLESIQEVNQNIDALNQKISERVEADKMNIVRSYEKIRSVSENFDVRKLAACTRDEKRVFYILCGWMTEEDAEKFYREVENDSNVFCIFEEDHSNLETTPPTKLRNPAIFKPFEMFIKMYGLPSYDEFDPTIFVALTYAFIFGAMFGDVGQGLLLTIGGYLLYRVKRMDLAAIVSCAGVCSTFFGFMFGSIFGFEDVIDAVWLRPIEHKTQLPLVGNLNTVFIVAIVFGMFLILVTMVFHIINGLKSRDIESTVFDNNGIAGLIFYGTVITSLVLIMTNHVLPAGIILGTMFGVPLIMIALKEPLSKLIEHKADFLPEEKGMFLVQTFFELFEVLLSYFSNTLSFVRIGAFAVSHAAMMEVVLMLAGAEHGTPNILVVIIGNLFVCAMEGLIVGIQVLRLEYNEMFSRFYKGTGREFKPYTNKNIKLVSKMLL